MRKSLAAIAMVAALALCGCGNPYNAVERDKHDTTADGRFITEDSDTKFETVVDSHTGVTYIIYERRPNSKYSTSGMTVLLNRDGSPVISEEVE